MIFIIAIILLLAAVFFFRRSANLQQSSGLPPGRVVYSDTGIWKEVEQPLYDAMLRLTGRPDYLVEQNGMLIPVEVKSAWAPATPYEGHVYQLAAYCLLVEKTYNRRPTHGILKYRNRTFAIDYTKALEANLLDTLSDMRRYEKRGDAERSHEEPARCARCGFRSVCDERL